LPQHGLVINMVSFNIGVELGQVLALTVMLAGFVYWRRYSSFHASALAANALLMAAGFVLMGFQIGGYAAEADGQVVRLADDSASPIRRHEDGLLEDAVSLTIAPGDLVEYKYRMDEGAPMLYSWQATAAVGFDFHTEPQNTESSDSISFDSGEADKGVGSYVAPFDGMHGWYWKNTTNAAVTLTLTTNGFYRGPTEYKSDGSRVPHTLRR
jgi:hypothetical protein